MEVYTSGVNVEMGRQVQEGRRGVEADWRMTCAPYDVNIMPNISCRVMCDIMNCDATATRC